MRNTLAVSHRCHERGVKGGKPVRLVIVQRGVTGAKQVQTRLCVGCMIQFFLTSLISAVLVAALWSDQSKDKIKQLNNQAGIETAH